MTKKHPMKHDNTPASVTYRECQRCYQSFLLEMFGGIQDSYCRNCQEESYQGPYWRDVYHQEDYRKDIMSTQHEIRMALTEDQKSSCAICGKYTTTLNIDHDHVTGYVRGLLCYACNMGLGAFKDNTVILDGAIKYLTQGRVVRRRIRYASHSQSHQRKLKHF